MATRSLAPEEKYALPLAVGFHVLLVVVLLWKPVGDAIVQPPERVTVSLTDESGLISTAPMPVPDAAPPAAGEALEVVPAETTLVEPIPQPRSEPVSRPRSEPAPRPRSEPVVRPATRAERAPARQPSPRPAQREAQRPSAQRQAAAKAAEPKGQIGSDFLGSRGTNEASQNSGSPAAEIGPRVRNSLASSISRQLKPHWSAPQGADAEQLVTILAFDLNQDGSLSGSPRVVRQTGITDANRAQAGRHAEQAIRAVRLAAPFNLPEEYYDAWKRVSDFRFDRRL